MTQPLKVRKKSAADPAPASIGDGPCEIRIKAHNHVIGLTLAHAIRVH